MGSSRTGDLDASDRRRSSRRAQRHGLQRRVRRRRRRLRQGRRGGPRQRRRRRGRGRGRRTGPAPRRRSGLGLLQCPPPDRLQVPHPRSAGGERRSTSSSRLRRGASWRWPTSISRRIPTAPRWSARARLPRRPWPWRDGCDSPTSSRSSGSSRSWRNEASPSSSRGTSTSPPTGTGRRRWWDGGRSCATRSPGRRPRRWRTRASATRTARSIPTRSTHPGLTWWARRPQVPGWNPGPQDPEDRIDFLFAAGPAIAKTSRIVGEAGRRGVDIGIADPWPSDHRGVVATSR